MTDYETLRIKKTVTKLFDDVEFVYRKYHPEMQEIYLSKSKLMFEAFKFYLQKTEKAVQE